MCVMIIMVGNGGIYMIQTESKQIILSIVGISILIIAFVGVSYAAYNSFISDSNSNMISTGTISLSFNNQSKSVSMNSMMPMSDEVGKNLTGDGNVYDFVVRTNLAPHTTLNYEISAEKVKTDTEMLSDDSVKLYLQKYDLNQYVDTPITSIPQYFNALTEDSFLGSKKGTMILYSGTFSNTSDEAKDFSENFRLRMWVDQNTIIDSVSRNFNIKLNVTAKVI